MANEKMKRLYRGYLQSAEGYAQATIDSIFRSLWKYETHTAHEDFKLFRIELPISFKESLVVPVSAGKQPSVRKQAQILKHLKAFFAWLGTQSGYKSAITRDKIQYFNPDRKQRLLTAMSVKSKEYPSMEYVQQLVNSIEIRNDIDRRDRAIIIFLFLTGMRDLAVATMRVGLFDPQKMRVEQDPEQGVRTKFGKRISTTLFGFDQNMCKELVSWHTYITGTLGFMPSAPLFPKTHTVRNSDSQLFESIDVCPEFWTSATGIRKMLKARSLAAGLPYYYPHLFRDTTKALAYSFCRTGEELQAVSDNLGHDKIDTTVFSYGKLSASRLSDVISSLGSKPIEQLEGLSPAAVEVARLLDGNNLLATLVRK
jgi:site-specific recombinase XerD